MDSYKCKMSLNYNQRSCENSNGPDIDTDTQVANKFLYIHFI